MESRSGRAIGVEESSIFFFLKFLTNKTDLVLLVSNNRNHLVKFMMLTSAAFIIMLSSLGFASPVSDWCSGQNDFGVVCESCFDSDDDNYFRNLPNDGCYSELQHYQDDLGYTLPCEFNDCFDCDDEDPTRIDGSIWQETQALLYPVGQDCLFTYQCQDGNLAQTAAVCTDRCFDNDGDGDEVGPVEYCSEFIDRQDCNDNDPTIYHGAEETCNGIDDDCDNAADEGLICSSCSQTVIGATLNTGDLCAGEFALQLIAHDENNSIINLTFSPSTIFGDVVIEVDNAALDALGNGINGIKITGATLQSGGVLFITGLPAPIASEVICIFTGDLALGEGCDGADATLSCPGLDGMGADSALVGGLEYFCNTTQGDLSLNPPLHHTVRFDSVALPLEIRFERPAVACSLTALGATWNTGDPCDGATGAHEVQVLLGSNNDGSDIISNVYFPINTTFGDVILEYYANGVRISGATVAAGSSKAVELPVPDGVTQICIFDDAALPAPGGSCDGATAILDCPGQPSDFIDVDGDNVDDYFCNISQEGSPGESLTVVRVEGLKHSEVRFENGDTETPFSPLSSLFSLQSPNPILAGQFGQAIAVGDVDGDDKDDFIIGAPLESANGHQFAGKAYVFSGATGTLLFSLQSPDSEANAQFGFAVGAGDADGDGNAEIFIAAPYESYEFDEDGGIYIFSSSGTFDRRIGTFSTSSVSFPFRRLGELLSVTNVIGDSKVELLASAAHPEENIIYTIDPRTGEVPGGASHPFNESHEFARGLSAGYFTAEGSSGSAFSVIGGESDGFSEHLYLFQHTSFVRDISNPSPESEQVYFGSGYHVIGSGAIDGTEISGPQEALLVGSPGATVSGIPFAGKVHVFDTTDWSLKHTLVSPNAQSSGQFSIPTAGFGLIAVGASGEGDLDGYQQGRVYLFRGTTAQHLQTLTSPDQERNGAFFGSQVLFARGSQRLVVSAPQHEVNGIVGAGKVFVFGLDADEDGDGYALSQGDCDDQNAAINPGATELCDGIDNNCNSLIDDDVPSDEQPLWYLDADDDGFGDRVQITETTVKRQCDQPLGYSPTNNDNCPGTANADQLDTDGDGQGDACEIDPDDDGDGVTVGAGDCDDSDAEVYPGAVETCDGVDNNCDGTEEDAASEEKTLWYKDLDGDGVGGIVEISETTVILACSKPVGYAPENTDNCTNTANPDQSDSDGDGQGDACDFDDDGDGLDDLVESILCPNPSGCIVDIPESDGISFSIAFAEIDPNTGELLFQIRRGDTQAIFGEIVFPAGTTVPSGSFSIYADVTLKWLAVTGFDLAGGTKSVTLNQAIGAGERICVIDSDSGIQIVPNTPDDCQRSDVAHQIALDCPGLVTVNWNDGSSDTYSCANGTVTGLKHSAIFVFTDADRDDFASGADCNDLDAAIHPGAAEVCDGIDNNCGSGIDEGGICDAIDQDNDGVVTGDENELQSIAFTLSTAVPGTAPTVALLLSALDDVVRVIHSENALLISKQAAAPLSSVLDGIENKSYDAKKAHLKAALQLVNNFVSQGKIAPFVGSVLSGYLNRQLSLL